jgi:NAD(P)-dependent dehydrogenase (short-subunit alcohol dehydrogenase family)
VEAQAGRRHDVRVHVAPRRPDDAAHGPSRRAADSVGGDAEGRRLDLSDESSIELFFQELGAFDHLVYTAGDTLQLDELAAMDLKKTKGAFELRFWSAVAAVKYASPHIREGGSIVLTTGVAGLRPRKGWVVAASGCGAIVSLTRALAVELAPIRVNAVSPGVVRTNLWQNMMEQDPKSMYENVCKTLLVGHVGEPAEIARAYVFLMQEGYSTARLLWSTAARCWSE